MGGGGSRDLKGMQKSSLFGGDPMAEAVRKEIRSVLERLLAEELAAEPGAGPYARSEGPRGCRHGSEERTLQTSWGSTTLGKPRGRLRRRKGTRNSRAECSRSISKAGKADPSKAKG